jgi:hypothetical protein
MDVKRVGCEDVNSTENLRRRDHMRKGNIKIVVI